MNTSHPTHLTIVKNDIRTETQLWDAIGRQSDYLQRHELMLTKVLRIQKFQNIGIGIGFVVLAILSRL